MRLKIFKVFLLLIFFSSCKHEPKTKDIPLQFEATTVIKKSGEGCHTDDFNCSIISLNIPIAQGPKEISERINQEIQSHVFSLIFSEEPSKAANYEEFAKDFISDRQRVAAEFEESAPWKALVTGALTKETEDLLSMAIESEIFTGGAHGYSSISYFNFDPKSGKAYSHSDIFTPEFRGFAEEAFRKKYDIPLDAPINSTGFWFEGDKFKLPINIGFEKEYLILLYNTYEIASYADGEFLMKFPIAEIKPYLKINLE